MSLTNVEKMVLVKCLIFVAASHIVAAIQGDCNFENGVCNWVNVQAGDHFDWTTRSGSTPSSQTGPNSDRYGNVTANYLYIETSSPRRVGDVARLESSVLYHRSYCFTFWYHMFGSSIAKLDIYAQSASGSKQLRWTMSGNQGNIWHKADVDFNINNITASYKILIEGVCGSSFTGDIAVDDFLFKVGPCSPPRNVTSTSAPTTSTPTPTTTTRYPPGNNCTFENNRFCSWQNAAQPNEDDFDWTIGSGSTSSSGTGPSRDHYGSTIGRYSYIETSSPRTPGQKAKLYSSLIPVSAGPTCFTFWYHMYGSDIGQLNIAVQGIQRTGATVNATGGEQLRWRLSGNQGTSWRKAAVAVVTTALLHTTNYYRVMIEGVRGNDFRGDIAIDDLKFHAGYCTTVPPKAHQPHSSTTRQPTRSPSTVTTPRQPITLGDCNFETGMCNWVNVQTGDHFDWTTRSGSTPSSQTGPNSDRYGNVTAKYLYIETSSPRRAGDVARLESSVLYHRSYCFTFWYHMFGSSIAKLDIYAQSASGYKQLRWTMSGNRGNIWHKADVDFNINNITTSYKILIEGVCGSSFTGDIAVDDFLFKVGPCSPPRNVTSTSAPTTSTPTPTTTTRYPPGNNCTFENNRFCSWQNAAQPNEDDFDWTIGSGSTSSSGTGPSRDHYGSTIGRYSYIETSSPRTPGQKAKLYSSLIPVSAGPTCFTFWYHMYGSDIGQLNIAVQGIQRTGATVNATGGEQLRWRLSGNQGTSWRKAAVAVGTTALLHTTNYYRVMIEGVRGNDFRGDIAIDDLKFHAGYCTTVPPKAHQPHSSTTRQPTRSPSTVTTPRQPITLGDCNFETGMCNWVNVQTGDHFDWTTRSGSTPSSQTGPNSDRYGNVTAKYLYIETSSPRRAGDVARLESSVLYHRSYCFTFWYHMFGSSIAKLDIYAQSASGYKQLRWTMSGNRGNIWHKADVDFNINNITASYKILIEGVCGSSFTGDIAVDDFLFKVGPCSPPRNVTSTSAPTTSTPTPTTTTRYPPGNNCTFENNRFCSWQNAAQPNEDDFDWTIGSGSTSSSGTGPSRDHYGSTIGRYSYIETSSPRTPGQKAKLYSSLIPVSAGPTCFTFWYHMYGSDIGQLNIAVQGIQRTGATVNATGGEQLRWRLSGNQGTSWRKAAVAVGTTALLHTTNYYRVMIEGVRGNDFRGDIAIDDLKFHAGYCTTVPPKAHQPHSSTTRQPTRSPSTVTTPRQPITLGDCNFETGMCNWVNVQTGDHFDWTTRSGSTPSSQTGPNSDRYGNVTAKYLYIETSSPRRAGDVARLESSVLYHRSYCFTFWYHMFGSSIAKLDIYAQSASGYKQLRWTMSGNRGNIWHKADVDFNINNITTSYKILIEGVCGSSFTGDIAVDDFLFKVGPCSPPRNVTSTSAPTTSTPTPTTTTRYPPGNNCTFENNRFCSWQNAAQPNEDDFDWTIGSGSTSSSGTGPSRDHYGSTIGRYSYIETSSPRTPGQKAKLYSSLIPVSAGPTCFTFWYHMYGSDIGQLNIAVQGIQRTGATVNATGGEQLRWRLSGNQGTSWRKAAVAVGTTALLHTTNYYRVMIEGVRGNDFRGDIAIDDLKFHAGYCTTVPPKAHQPHSSTTRQPTRSPSTVTTPRQPTTLGDCNFETGMCNWVNVQTGDHFDWTTRSGSTPSSQTGPNSDRYGNVTAKYLYIETSSPRRAGDVARLESSVLYHRSYCFTFWYHMFGSSIAKLDIYAQSASGYKQLRWTMSGNRGNIWHKADVDFNINNITASYKILIEGVCGSSFTGDIAVDDFLFKVGPCSPPRNVTSTSAPTTSTPTPTTTTRYPPGNNCTFENNRFCSWQNAAQPNEDDFDWTIGSGSTSSSGTGPSRDHYGSTIGRYSYIETSSPRTPGQKAKLYSSLIPVSAGPTCFTFWYHMYGSDIGQLNIAVQGIQRTGATVNATGGEQLRWRLSGNQGTSWRKAAVAVGTTALLHTTNYYRVMIEGVRGNDFRGDIAIDDLKFHAGYCTTVPPKAHQPHSSTTRQPTRSPSTVTTPRQPTTLGDCNFETGMCNWVNVQTGDHFDWTTRSGSTPSSQTGPNSDRYGNVTAKYLYIETSSPRRAGDVARLESSVLYHRSYCFTFWYHMFGSSIAKLDIYAQSASGYKQLRWTMSGNRGNIWHKADVDFNINNITASYKILIEGVCGSSFTGDIAVDDFLFKVGPCSPPRNVTSTSAPTTSTPTPTTTTRYPPGNNCTFENNRFCSWQNAAQPNEDDFDWTIGSGSTSSSGTGPSRDHYGSTIGRYSYIETSSPRTPGQKAKLYSSLIPVSAGPTCFTFWYHMYGSDIGQLNIAVQGIQRTGATVNATGGEQLRWRLSGNQGTSWRKAAVAVGTTALLHTTNYYRVMIEGVRGNDFRGDIAIDDLKFHAGYCTTVPPKAHQPHSSTTRQPTRSPSTVTTPRQPTTLGDCNFETGMCNWVNVQTGDHFDWTTRSGSTPSSQTGPNSDRYGNVTAKYLYIETSSPRRAGDVARLESSVLYHRSYCFTFWYHMFGSSIAKLDIYAQSASGYKQLRWTMSGNRGNIWHKADVDFNINNITASYKILIEGVCGSSFTGDIAVDDFLFKVGPCSPPRNVTSTSAPTTSTPTPTTTTRYPPGNNCTFENNRFCSWQNAAQPNEDDFDWTIGSGSTSSSGTGPSRDHYGSTIGRYSYIETSSPRTPGQKAKLYSSLIPVSAGPTCFTFWYHMYGSDIGQLNIAVQGIQRTGATVNATGGEQLRWRLSGNQGTSWRKAAVAVGTTALLHTTNYYRVMIEGVRGNDFRGDIAIDDLKFHAGYCTTVPPKAHQPHSSTTRQPTRSPSTVTTPRQPTTLGDCNFETGMCNWVNVQTGDHFDWTTRSGSTPSSQTGPNSDRYGNVTAKYLYIETSSPRRAGDVARLESSVLYHRSYCFTFWYHMFGSSIAKLDIYAQSASGYKQLRWTMSGNRGNIWHKADVDFNINNITASYKILIEGVCGSSFTGDIAVDDFLFKVGPCSPPRNVTSTSAPTTSTPTPTTTTRYPPGNNCTFENNRFCSWQNAAQPNEDDFDWTIGSGSTSSSGTGPSRDHYGSTIGRYSYIETSSPRTPGQKAKLYSSLIPVSAGPTCFTFWYHMYGSDIGQLNIAVQGIQRTGATVNATGGEQLRWRLSGNQGTSWRKAAVAVGTTALLHTTNYYRVMIEGVRGNDFRGDIAIDDLKFHAGYCTTAPPKAHQPHGSTTRQPTWSESSKQSVSISSLSSSKVRSKLSSDTKASTASFSTSSASSPVSTAVGSTRSRWSSTKTGWKSSPGSTSSTAGHSPNSISSSISTVGWSTRPKPSSSRDTTRHSSNVSSHSRVTGRTTSSPKSTDASSVSSITSMASSTNKGKLSSPSTVYSSSTNASSIVASTNFPVSKTTPSKPLSTRKGSSSLGTASAYTSQFSSAFTSESSYPRETGTVSTQLSTKTELTPNPITEVPKADLIADGKCTGMSNKTGNYFEISWKIPTYSKVDAKGTYTNMTIKSGKSFRTFQIKQTKNKQVFMHKSDVSFRVGLQFCNKTCNGETEVVCRLFGKSSSGKAEGTAPVVGASIGAVVVVLAIAVVVVYMLKKGIFGKVRRNFKRIGDDAMEDPLDITWEDSKISLGFTNEVYSSTSEV